MSLTADQNGQLTGQFTILENIPAGTKRVTFLGDGGSFGEATYTGSGQIVIEQRRRVATQVFQRFDPLAQTFTLNTGRHLAGVEVWFTTRGTLPVRAQIRETATGLPTGVVLAEGEIKAADIRTAGSATRILFDNPVWLEGQREYAMVLLTDDSEHAVAVAELGKYDPRQGWITAQPYQVGVLLSSSNASTWTPHQTMDLAFRLLAARFTQTLHTVDLGEIDADGITDLMALASIDRTGPDTDVTFVLTGSDGTELHIKEGQPVNLPKAISGKWRIKAEIIGSTSRAAAIYPGIQAVLGKLRTEADYVSRAVPCGTNARVVVRFEAHLPGQSAVDVYLERNGGFVPVNLTSAKPVDETFEERTCAVEAFTSDTTRVKLVLKGSPDARPRVRNLRLIVTD